VKVSALISWCVVVALKSLLAVSKEMERHRRFARLH